MNAADIRIPVFSLTEFTKVGLAPSKPLGHGKEQSPERFWALQMVRKTFYSTVISRGKVLCAKRGKRSEVQRSYLRERGFLLHTSVRGAQVVCGGRVRKEICKGATGFGIPSQPQSAPHTQATVGRAGPAWAVGGEGESRDRWGVWRKRGG